MSDEPVDSYSPGTTTVEDPAKIVVDSYAIAADTNVIEWNTTWTPAEYTTDESFATVLLSDILQSLILKNTSLSESGSATVYVWLYPKKNGSVVASPLAYWDFTTPTIAPDTTYSVDTTTKSGIISMGMPDFLIGVDELVTAFGGDMSDGVGTAKIRCVTAGTETDVVYTDEFALPNLVYVAVDAANASVASNVKREVYTPNDLFPTLQGSIATIWASDTTQAFIETKVYAVDGNGVSTVLASRTLSVDDIVNIYGAKSVSNVDLRQILPQSIDLSSLTAGVYNIGVAFGVA